MRVRKRMMALLGGKDSRGERGEGINNA